MRYTDWCCGVPFAGHACLLSVVTLDPHWRLFVYNTCSSCTCRSRALYTYTHSIWKNSTNKQQGTKYVASSAVQSVYNLWVSHLQACNTSSEGATTTYFVRVALSKRFRLPVASLLSPCIDADEPRILYNRSFLHNMCCCTTSGSWSLQCDTDISTILPHFYSIILAV